MQIEAFSDTRGGKLQYGVTGCRKRRSQIHLEDAMVSEDADRGVLRYTRRKIAIWCYRSVMQRYTPACCRVMCR